MSFSITYKKLFDVRLLHDFYLDKADTSFSDLSSDEQQEQLKKYQAEDFIQIMPSQHTRKLLIDHKLVFKRNNRGFTLFTLIDPSDSDQTFLPLEELKLEFLLVLTTRYFFNFTSLPLSGNVGHIYYYSNLAGSGGASFPSLSLPLPPYANGTNYSMGDLVSFGGQGYMAEINLSPSTVNPGNPGSGWQLLDTSQYASVADRIPVHSSFYDFTYPGTSIEIEAEVFDMKGNLVYTRTHDNTGGNTSQKIDLRNLESGKYNLVITDTSGPTELENFDFFLNNTLPATASIFGVVDIFINRGTSYDVLDMNGDIRENEYEIRFKNRSTSWRYIANSDKSVLLETGPNPLTHTGYLKVVINSTDMPNPDISFIKPEVNRIFSEIYVNTM